MTSDQTIYARSADLLLVVHFVFVTFVLAGFMVIWLGHWLKWLWVQNFYFRLAHLLAMGFVLLETVAGIICPLTIWENQLRDLAGQQARYSETFIQHWLHRVMFYELNEDVFKTAYALFFLLVVITFWKVPPRRRLQDGRGFGARK
jgi:hypothetical protein